MSATTAVDLGSSHRHVIVREALRIAQASAVDLRFSTDALYVEATPVAQGVMACHTARHGLTCVVYVVAQESLVANATVQAM